MVNRNVVVKDIQQQLRKVATEKVRNSTLHFFKEKINPIGVNNPTMRRIAKTIVRHYKEELGTTSAVFWLDVCESLLQTSVYEDGLAGLFLLAYDNSFKESVSIDYFERFIEKYVDNWAWDDSLCCEIGNYFLLYPAELKRTKKWVRSNNRWVARAAVVSLIPVVRKKKEIPLLLDHVCYLKKTNDDLLHKACGWALREAWKKEPKLIENFLLKEKGLPRTTVRYAIERLSEGRRKRFLEETK